MQYNTYTSIRIRVEHITTWFGPKIQLLLSADTAAGQNTLV